MFDSINIGASALVGFSKDLQNISNNVANLNTTGFKGSRSQFTDLFEAGGEGDSGTADSQNQTGAGMATLRSITNFSQGQINRTGQDLDVAVSGDGFFVLHDTSGKTSYSRDGGFQFDADGVLVNANGDHVQGLAQDGSLQDITIASLHTNAASASTTITVSGSLSTADTDKTVSGISVTDSAGGTHTLSIDFTNDTATTAGSWQVAIKDGTTTVGTGNIAFNDGVLDPAHSSVSFTYSPTGAAPMPMTLTVAPSTTSVSSGSSTLSLSSVDGHGKGDLTKSTFDSSGHLVLSYSNGQTTKTQQLAIALFATNSALREVSGNRFVNDDPQAVSIGAANGTSTSLTADSLEGSNVDLSTEFSNIIITQRGYQAASELVSTANQMLDTLLHMKG